MNQALYKTYAEVVVRIGCALQKGQKLTISAPVECAAFARALAEAAFLHGAPDVEIYWNDEQVSRLRYLYGEQARVCSLPGYLREQRMAALQEGAAYVAISAKDPDAYAGVDPNVVQRARIATRTALKPYFEAMNNNVLQWCIASVPTQAWANKVFPNEADPVGALWKAIAHAVRLDEPDPIAAWQAHIQRLNRRMEKLNALRLSALHYHSQNGTDLTVGLAREHIWCGGADMAAKNGASFIANMPTEEVFTTPDRLRVEGVVKNALPLVYNGAVIDGFSLTFREGRVERFSAARGEAALGALLDTDEGARYLGEAALVSADSPIAQMGVLFYNTLFDENAACHLALGSSYPSCIQGGAELPEESLRSRGGNTSLLHADFMIGTEDLSIEGLLPNGLRLPIFQNGVWAGEFLEP